MANPATGTIPEGVARLLSPIETSDPEGLPDDETQVTEPEEIPEEVLPEVEGDSATAEEPQEEAGETEPETYEISVNGETRAVTLDELRNGHMRLEDYKQKTMALAEQRKDDETNRAQLAERLEQAEFVAQLESEDLTSTTALELKEYDPTAYYEKKERFDKKQERLKELRADAVQQAEKQAQARTAREQELLIPAIPEWVDNEKALEEIKLCQDLWSRMGFTQADLKNMPGHFMIALSRKAALYDRITAAKPEGKKVTTKPKTAKPGTVKTSDDRARAKRKDAQAQFDDTHKLDDAVKLLLE